METNRIKFLVTLISDAESAIRYCMPADGQPLAFVKSVLADLDRERAALCNLIERRELGAKGEASEEVTEGAALVSAGMRRAGHVLSDSAPDGAGLPCPGCALSDGTPSRVCGYRFCPLCGA